MDDTIKALFVDGLIGEDAKLDSPPYPASRGLSRSEARMKAPAFSKSLVRLLMFMNFVVILPELEYSRSVSE